MGYILNAPPQVSVSPVRLQQVGASDVKPEVDSTPVKYRIPENIPPSVQPAQDFPSVLAPKNQSEYETYAYLQIDLNYPDDLRSKLLNFNGADDKLMFTFLPEEISVSGATPSWNSVEVIGRFSPYYVWSGTSAEEFSFNLQFYAWNDAIYDVRSKVDWLRALKYPVVSNGISYRPPAVDFHWGNFIQRRCIITGAEPTYHAPWQVVQGQFDLSSMYAEVSVSLITVPESFISASNVMAGVSA